MESCAGVQVTDDLSLGLDVAGQDLGCAARRIHAGARRPVPIRLEAEIIEPEHQAVRHAVIDSRRNSGLALGVTDRRVALVDRELIDADAAGAGRYLYRSEDQGRL